MVTPQHKNPYPGGHKIYNFLGRPFLGHHYYLLSFVWTIPRSREEDIFKEIHQFKTVVPQNYIPTHDGHLPIAILR